MTPEVRAEYKRFFHETEAGRYFLDEIARLRATNHQKAENDPELARDFMQRAKGNTEVTDHISSVLTDIKKGSSKRK